MSFNAEHALPWLGAGVFALALIHSFSTRFFEQLAHRQPRHAGLWHLLGEVEVVFGLWASVLMLLSWGLTGQEQTLSYLESRNFTEPLFVFAIMVIAGTRPVLALTRNAVMALAQHLPFSGGVAMFALVLSLVPLLGSFITEPAAMTLAALLLRETLFAARVKSTLKYATLGVLFVNVSIGGTLTTFAAPPVLMVAGPWGWDFQFMLTTFGWKAAIAVLINTLVLTIVFRRTLAELDTSAVASSAPAVPWSVTLVHVLFLVSVVYFAHHPVVFVGLMLLFLGFTTAYSHHQNPLILREALLVAFFLAGLVVLGGHQQWWLEPLLLSLSPEAVFYGATALTAITDNAALTYLGSLVPGLSDAFKESLVAGAVAGGGLTLIANAPNPAAAAILKMHFPDQTIEPLKLLLAALPATAVAMLAFRWL